MIKHLSNQAGSAHVVITITLVVALIGALGFIAWQNLVAKDAEVAIETMAANDKPLQSADPVSETTSGMLSLTVNSKELTIDVGDSKYNDVVAIYDEEKGHYDIYSKDLLARVNTSNGAAAMSTSGCNVTVVVDSYPADDVSGSYNKVGEANGKFVHAGFLGPCEPTANEALNNEMYEFRDYVVVKMKTALN